jgi:hypothetical protein
MVPGVMRGKQMESKELAIPVYEELLEALQKYATKRRLPLETAVANLLELEMVRRNLLQLHDETESTSMPFRDDYWDRNEQKVKGIISESPKT